MKFERILGFLALPNNFIMFPVKPSSKTSADFLTSPDEAQKANQIVKLLQPKFVLIQLEGIITSRRWEEEQIRPYIRDNLLDFWRRNYNWEQIQAWCREYEPFSILDHSGPKITPLRDNPTTEQFDASLLSLYKYIFWSIDRDKFLPCMRKKVSTCWELAFRDKLIKLQIEDDVLGFLDTLKKADTQIAISSIFPRDIAQLILSSTTAGDISKYFTDYFDYNCHGDRSQQQFYMNVVEKYKIYSTQKSSMLIVADEGQPVKSAISTGWQGIICLRYDNHVRQYYLMRFPNVRTLKNIQFSVPVAQK